MKKPKGKFIICDARGVAVFKTLHVRFTRKGEQMERIYSPRQFIRAYDSKLNCDWLLLQGGLCCVLETAKIFRCTASVMIYPGYVYIEHVGSSIVNM